MIESSVYQQIAARTDGSLYIGVVGPVRTGKSTFIKRFMETLVLPAMSDPYAIERARDELPQSGSGKTITTAEPKFVPETAIRLEMENGMSCAVRMVDCVGYMVPGAVGSMENGVERMVMTPWYDQEIPMSQAAEEGTMRVISEHATIGVLVTTDGSVCGIPREDYIPAEERAAGELQQSGKPFLVLLNCTEPEGEAAISLAEELGEKYRTVCLPVNCMTLDEDGVRRIIAAVLEEFPITSIRVFLPAWAEALGDDCAERAALFTALLQAADGTQRVADVSSMASALAADEMIEKVTVSQTDLATGDVSLEVALPNQLYYDIISAQSGFPIHNDRDLMLLLRSVSGLKEEYERVHEALESVRSTGYGIVMPTLDEMHLEEPQIVRQGGRYGVRLKASAPSIHMMMANIETEVSPAIGGESASEEVINFLLEGYDGDINRIWESNIFGKPLNDIAAEGLNSKIRAMPEDAQGKLRMTIQRIINEGSGGLICIIL